MRPGPSTIMAEPISEGSAYAVTDTDGRGRSIGETFYVSAESEREATAAFLVQRVRSISERIANDGTIGGEKLA